MDCYFYEAKVDNAESVSLGNIEENVNKIIDNARFALLKFIHVCVRFNVFQHDKQECVVVPRTPKLAFNQLLGLAANDIMRFGAYWKVTYGSRNVQPLIYCYSVIINILSNQYGSTFIESTTNEIRLDLDNFSGYPKEM